MRTPGCLYHNRVRAHFAPGVPVFKGNIGAVHPSIAYRLREALQSACTSLPHLRTNCSVEQRSKLCCCKEDRENRELIRHNSKNRLLLRRRRFDLNMQFAKLFEFNFAGSFGHEIHGSLGLGEGDAITNVVQSTKQHDNAIDA